MYKTDILKGEKYSLKTANFLLSNQKLTSIDYISDLHLEYHFSFVERKFDKYIESILPEYSNYEFLVIAGDISDYNSYSKTFLKKISKFYKHVIVVLGNHDLYLPTKTQQRKYYNSHNRVIDLIYDIDIPRNVHFVGQWSNNLKVLKSNSNEMIAFVGGFLGYPTNSKSDEYFYKNVSYDSDKIIGIEISPQEVYNFEKNVLQSLLKAITTTEEIDKTVLVTHVPPIITQSHVEFNSTACYYAPLNKTLLPKYNIFGHTHEVVSLEKEGKKFYSNGIGFTKEKIKSFYLV